MLNISILSLLQEAFGCMLKVFLDFFTKLTTFSVRDLTFTLKDFCYGLAIVAVFRLVIVPITKWPTRKAREWASMTARGVQNPLSWIGAYYAAAIPQAFMIMIILLCSHDIKMKVSALGVAWLLTAPAFAVGKALRSEVRRRRSVEIIRVGPLYWPPGA